MRAFAHYEKCMKGLREQKLSVVKVKCKYEYAQNSLFLLHSGKCIG